MCLVWRWSLHNSRTLCNKSFFFLWSDKELLLAYEKRSYWPFAKSEQSHFSDFPAFQYTFYRSVPCYFIQILKQDCKLVEVSLSGRRLSSIWLIWGWWRHSSLNRNISPRKRLESLCFVVHAFKQEKQVITGGLRYSLFYMSLQVSIRQNFSFEKDYFFAGYIRQKFNQNLELF